MLQLGEAIIGRGHQLDVICLERDETHLKLEELGSSIMPVPQLRKTPRTLNPWRLLASGLKSCRIKKLIADRVEQVKAELLIINSENMFAIPKAGKMAQVSTAVIIRGIRFAELGILGKVYFRLQKRWVDRYMAVSKTVRDRMQDMGVSSNQISVTPNGVDTTLYKVGPSKLRLRDEFAIPESAPLIGTVCHLVPRKGVHHLLEAMKKIDAKVPSAHLLVLGDVPNGGDPRYAEILKNTAIETGLSRKVHFAGYRSETHEILKCIDVLAHPSETESFGRVIAEAMACGRPVVGFRVGAVGELIVDGETGLLAEPFDIDTFASHIVQLVKDKTLRDRLGEASRKRAVANYDLRKCLDRLVNELVELV
jgi:glycosyltransferase involved in cell wall biosynthesis